MNFIKKFTVRIETILVLVLVIIGLGIGVELGVIIHGLGY